jgi:MraZ protein
VRSLDERFRLSMPPDWAELLAGRDGQCTLAKEQPGCLSVWNNDQSSAWLAEGIDLLRSKLGSGRLREQTKDVQQLGRLLSTRHRAIPIAGRGRLAIPDSFREFLGVDPGGNVLVVGAVVCVELWQPQRWGEHIGRHMPEFGALFDQLTR